MKTRDRILLVSLDLFNLCGEPNVTTIDIANEMDISPGNLYYHYRNKDEIIFELFKSFEADISQVLGAPQDLQLQMMDIWLYIHLIFEKIWTYRFLYRDLATIMERNDKLHARFNRILDKKLATAQVICRNLSEAGAIALDAEDIEALANNIVLTATYWLNFQHIRNRDQMESDESIGRGAYQLMSVVAPYMREEDKSLLKELSKDFIA